MIKFSLFGLKTLVTILVRFGGNWMAQFEIDASYVIIFTLCEIRMFYYLLCLEIVHIQLKMIEMESGNYCEWLRLWSYSRTANEMDSPIFCQCI